MPNQRIDRTDGSLVGSIASRPSDDKDGIGSVSKVARPKNWRSAACSRLSYSALAAKIGGSDMSCHDNSPAWHGAHFSSSSPTSHGSTRRSFHTTMVIAPGV